MLCHHIWQKIQIHVGIKYWFGLLLKIKIFCFTLSRGNLKFRQNLKFPYTLLLGLQKDKVKHEEIGTGQLVLGIPYPTLQMTVSGVSLGVISGDSGVLTRHLRGQGCLQLKEHRWYSWKHWAHPSAFYSCLYHLSFETRKLCNSCVYLWLMWYDTSLYTVF